MVFAPREDAASIGWERRDSLRSREEFDEKTSNLKKRRKRARKRDQQTLADHGNIVDTVKNNSFFPRPTVSDENESEDCSDGSCNTSLMKGQVGKSLKDANNESVSLESSGNGDTDCNKVDSSFGEKIELDNGITIQSINNASNDNNGDKGDSGSTLSGSMKDIIEFDSAGLDMENTSLYNDQKDAAHEYIMAISGRAAIRVLKGDVEIMGYRCGAAVSNRGLDCDEYIEVDFPPWHGAIQINPLFSTAPSSDRTVKLEIQSDKMYKEEKISSPNKSSRSSSTHQNKLRGKSYDLVSASSAPETRIIQISHRWRRVARDVTSGCKHNVNNSNCTSTSNLGYEINSTKNGTPRTLICGAKGVGKSTFLRFLVNQFLSWGPECQQVAVLDCDVGQPEFSPPGMLTLTVLSKPIMSLPHAHMVISGHSFSPKNPSSHHIASYYYGHTTSKADPSTYISIIATLIQHFNHHLIDIHQSNSQSYEPTSCGKDYKESIKNTAACNSKTPLPLIVNTDGWVKGLGNEILTSIIELTRPNNIVQIVGTSKSKIFDISKYFRDNPSEQNKGDCMLNALEQSHFNPKTHIIESFDTDIVKNMESYSNPEVLNKSSCVSNSYTLNNQKLDCDQNTSQADGDKKEYFSNQYLMVGMGRGRHTTKPAWMASTSPRRTANEQNTNMPQIFTPKIPASITPSQSLTPSLLRTMRICCYFLGGYDRLLQYGVTFCKKEDFNEVFKLVSRLLCEMKPYIVPFDAIMVHGEDNSSINDELICSIVGLCCSRSTADNVDNPENTVRQNNRVETKLASFFPCVGLGIVRGIDYQKKQLYILSPVHANILNPFSPSTAESNDMSNSSMQHNNITHTVDILSKGRIRLPFECMFRGEDSECFPFTSCDGLSLNISVPQISTNEN